MSSKRGLIFFVVVITFTILLSSFISATTCSITTSCPEANRVMRLSSSTNAHGALWNQGTYTYYLCCVGMTYYSAADNASMHTCSPASNPTNKILKLSATTNAHAQTQNEPGYSTNVCFGKFMCTSVTTTSCPSNYPIQVLSLSANTNAHLAQFSSTYGTKICCNDSSVAVCGNSIVEDGENCDCGASGSPCTSTQLRGQTCVGLGFNGGNLRCNPPGVSGCGYDTSQCCNNQCTPGATRCSGNNVQTCVSGSNGCYNWGTPTACLSGQTCSGGACVCVPTTCSALGRNCGTVSDGCGGTLNCGTCDDGNPCTTDICNSGTCANILINNCCTSNSQCNDNKVCTGPDTCNLATNTCSNPALSCGINNDGCCPLGCDIGDDNDCTICTRDSHCTNSPGQCNPGRCVSGSCTYPALSCGINNDGCCPQGCNAVNDNDCTATCGNGVRESGEQCDGTALGGATCASLMGAGYTLGAVTCTSGCTYNTSGCIPPCVLTSLSWNYSTPVGSPIVEGTPVLLNIAGTNCGGKTISFEIKEKDTIGADDDVIINPVPIIFPLSGNSAAGMWDAEWQSEGVPETDPPEYYFRSTVSGVTNSSSNSGVNDPQLLRVSRLASCGNGILEPGEQCDNGAALNGVPCTALYGDTCNYCSASCTSVTVQGGWCGDGVCNGPENCNNCESDCGPCPVTCEILDVYWSTLRILEGNNANMFVEATPHCNGRRINFEIWKDNGGGRDSRIENPGYLENINSYSSSNNMGIWRAEYEGNGEPAKYYFIANVVGLDISEKSDSIEVEKKWPGIVRCADYTDEYQCNHDGDLYYRVAENEPTCEKEPYYDSNMKCMIAPECGCTWNSASNICRATTIPKIDYCDGNPPVSNCGNGVVDAGEECEPPGEGNCGDDCNYIVPPSLTPVCGNGILERGEVCDGNELQLSDSECSHFDDFTSGTVNCYPQGHLLECTYNFSNCQGPLDHCGNGVVEYESNEECEPPGEGNCDTNCHFISPGSVCGNGIVELGETCDSNELQLSDSECSHFDEFTSGTVSCYPQGHQYQCTYNLENCRGDDNGGGTINYPNPGWCVYEPTTDDSCSEGVSQITVGIRGVMGWDPLNQFTEDTRSSLGLPDTAFFLDNTGVWRLGSIDKYNECITERSNLIYCPATVELPFFSVNHVAFAVALIGLIYIAYTLSRKDKKVVVSKKVKKRK